jgi:hypothetical protein
MSRKTENIPAASSSAQTTAPPTLSANSRTAIRRKRAVFRSNRAKFFIADCVSWLAVRENCESAPESQPFLNSRVWLLQDLFGLKYSGRKSGLALKF